MHPFLKSLVLLVVVSMLCSCEEHVILPKPGGELALNFKTQEYKPVTHTSCNYSFSANTVARIVAASDCSLKIEYPDQKATIFMSYRPVQDNLRELLIDGQKLSYGHNRKADVISDYPFSNPASSAYGMMYEVEGDAASNAQFYVTDSLNHFLTASLYFNTVPNYDSIFPAVNYVQKDMVKILITLKWE
ncbi:MAG: gliding motility lipoprotein GldD [Nonlabens sp.]